MGKRYYDISAVSGTKNKKTKISHGFVFWCAILSLIILASIGIFYFLIYGSFFKVKNIKVSGSKLFEPEEVIEIIVPNAIPSYPWRALFAPDHMLFWQFAKNRNVTSRTVSIFESVLVKPDWAGRALKIELRERSLFGIWCGDENTGCFAFDHSGVIFGRTPRAEGSLFLKIRNENPFSGFLGGNILPQENWVRNVFDTISIIKNGRGSANLITVKNYSLEEWEVELSEGPKLIFSLKFVPQNLGGLLRNLDKKIDLEKLEYVDFRVQNRIFYR